MIRFCQYTKKPYIRPGPFDSSVELANYLGHVKIGNFLNRCGYTRNIDYRCVKKFEPGFNSGIPFIEVVAQNGKEELETLLGLQYAEWVI